jgi:uncharacterized protein YjgD (DUF1641 family)
VAKPITNIEKTIPNKIEEEAQALEQLLKAVANQHQPMLKFLDILNELDRLGLLDAARGMLKNSHQIAYIGMNQMNKPGAHRIIKNGMGAITFLSMVDPDKLQTLLNGVASGIDHAVDDTPGKKQGGLWGMLKILREPQVMSSLSMMTGFLRGLGHGLKKQH